MRRSLKKVLSISLLFFMVFFMAGCKQESDNALYEPGTYEGTGEGYAGDITAEVTVTEDEISEINIDAPDETPSIAGSAEDEITSKVLDDQDLDVEIVSGATSSSEGIISAITAALEKAGADIDALKKGSNNKTTTDEEKQEDIEVDVAIIGAGGAGMSAAIEAAEAGKSVVILEKMPIVGGNTNFATGGMNASETVIQKEEGIEDSNKTFYEDTLKGGHDENNPELLQTMVDNSAEAVEWLNDLGANLTRVSLSGGATNPRIHTPEDGSAVGPVVIDTLADKLEELEVDTLLNTEATKLIKENDKIVGVEAEDKNKNPFTINAPAVILTTGGFGANSEMVVDYRSDLEGFSTTNHEGATGDGIEMALDVGADLTDIEEIQIHPTTHPESGFMFTEGLRGDGAILVNGEGERFTDELETRDVVSKNILDQPDGIAYLITNDAIREENAALDGYIEKDYAVKADTLEDLAKELDIDEETLKTTMETYEDAIEKGEDEEFNRKHLDTSLAEGKYYALEVTPGVHHTMGGVTIDTETHVLDESGDIIEGLFAAGELTGGIHGANRIGGNAVTDIIVFGRIAGQNVSK